MEGSSGRVKAVVWAKGNNESWSGTKISPETGEVDQPIRPRVIGICSWVPRDDPDAWPDGSPAEPCAVRSPRRSRLAPKLAWSVLHPDVGVKDKNGMALISRGWTPVGPR
jgi:hypothetical protein